LLAALLTAPVTPLLVRFAVLLACAPRRAPAPAALPERARADPLRAEADLVPREAALFVPELFVPELFVPELFVPRAAEVFARPPLALRPLAAEAPFPLLAGLLLAFGRATSDPFDELACELLDVGLELAIAISSSLVSTSGDTCLSGTHPGSA